MTRDEVRAILIGNIANVVFKKVSDNTIRKMRCTLISDLLPETKGTSTKQSQEVLPVWDLDANGWRSFRIDSIISVKLTDWEEF